MLSLQLHYRFPDIINFFIHHAIVLKVNIRAANNQVFPIMADIKYRVKNKRTLMHMITCIEKEEKSITW